MSKLKIHFSSEPGKELEGGFVQSLISDLGQASKESAQVLVSIGGDGSLLHLLRAAKKGQGVFGIVPPGSNSRGFWTNRIASCDTQSVLQALYKAEAYEICPLKAVITHKSGKTTLLRAFNEVAPAENSGQAMLVTLTMQLRENKIGPARIMGDGLIFSTAFGSTALNRTYGGPAIDIRNSGITVVGKGVYEPLERFPPTVAEDGTSFVIDFLSPDKRPVRVQYDGLVQHSNPEDPFVKIVIEKNKNEAVRLLLTDDPSTRAFSAMMP